MSKKKSLGSSPIGFSSSGSGSFSFIPDLGDQKTRFEPSGNGNSSKTANGAHLSEQKEGEKKIVSYYLEIGLIDRLKQFADERNHYYSSVVSDALEYWIEEHGN